MEKTLRQRAIDLLSRREHSRSELTRKLSSYTEDQSELARLLDDLAEHGWQSDERLTEQYIRMRSAKYGMQRIAQELRQRGIADSLIRDVVEQNENGEAYNVGYAQWQRKFGSLPATPQERAKQIRFLTTRGFSQSIIQKILKEEIEITDDYDSY